MRSMRLGIVFLAVAVVGLITVVGWTQTPSSESPKLRVGVYDSRAIALVWVRSKYYMEQLAAKKAEYEKAKAAGDTQRMEELSTWGETSQQKLHFMGFGEYPVHDELADVADKLPEVAVNAGVSAIVARCDYQAADVEIVDVTLELVKLFDPEPSEGTLRMIRDIKTTPAVPFETLIHMSPLD